MQTQIVAPIQCTVWPRKLPIISDINLELTLGAHPGGSSQILKINWLKI